MNKNNTYNVLGIEHKKYIFENGTAENYALHLATFPSKETEAAGLITFTEKVYTHVIDKLKLASLNEIVGKNVRLLYARNGRVIQIDIVE